MTKISLGSKRRTVFLSIGVPPFLNDYLTPCNFFFHSSEGKGWENNVAGSFQEVERLKVAERIPGGLQQPPPPLVR